MTKNKVLMAILIYHCLLSLSILPFITENGWDLIQNSSHQPVIMFLGLVSVILLTGIKNIQYYFARKLTTGLMLFNIFFSLLVSISFRTGGFLFMSMLGPQISVYFTSTNNNFGFEYSIWETALKSIVYDMATTPGNYAEINLMSLLVCFVLSMLFFSRSYKPSANTELPITTG